MPSQPWRRQCRDSDALTDPAITLDESGVQLPLSRCGDNQLGITNGVTFLEGTKTPSFTVFRDPLHSLPGHLNSP
jgi:hypothetical protein